MKLETVRVEKKGGGFMVINKTDFNPKVHTMYGAKKEATPKASAGMPEGYSVKKGGGGTWRVLFNDIEVEKGKGKGNLDAYLSTL